MTQTRFAKNKNPWTGEKMTKTNKPMKAIDPSAVSICDDPIPTSRYTPEGKYTPLFSKLEYGKALKCPPGTASAIAAALRKWLEDRKKPGTVRYQANYSEDGTGRVWLLEPEKKLKVAA
jgi:hypothetical protein